MKIEQKWGKNGGHRSEAFLREKGNEGKENSWIDFENIMLSEISQTEKVKNHVISLICVI